MEADTQRIESPNGEFRQEYFIQEKVEKVAECLTKPFFCMSCAIGLSGERGALSHLHARHPRAIDADSYEGERTATTTRQVAEVERRNADQIAELTSQNEVFQMHHGTHHANCQHPNATE